MELNQFINAANLFEKIEIEKVKVIAFYDNFVKGQADFSLNEIVSLLQSIGHPISNVSRLKNNMAKSKDFKKFNGSNQYMLTPSARQQLQLEYGELLNNEDEIASSNEVRRCPKLRRI